MSAHLTGPDAPQRMAEAIEELEYLNDVMGSPARQYRDRQRGARSRWVAGRLIAGETPALVWREYRGLDRAAVAADAGMDDAKLAAVDSSAFEPGLRVLTRLAHVLNVDLDAVVPWSQDGDADA